jgi:hypothetical protein
MNSKQFLESTTSGSVATVATPVGKTQTRGKGIYPNEKGGNLLTGKKTNKKYANSNPMKEAKLDEEDVIIVPGQGNRHKPGFIPKAKDRTDHEVEMAKSDLFQSFKNAKKVYELIKDIPETVGIEGWVQEKIIKANDYLNTVREYLEHKQLSEDTIQGKRDNFTVDDIKALEKIRDLETIKARAKELIKGFPDRRMKPEKIDYFYNRIDGLFSPMQVVKLMYDLLLAGEGMKTIGSRYSTSANSYQRRFDEMTVGVIAGGGVGEGLPGSLSNSDYTSGKTVKHTSTNCTTCHGRKMMYKLDDKLHADNKKGATKIKCPTCKGTGDKQDMAEGYRILPSIDREKYQERQGLEGPFRARNGKVYYYDPKAGLAYDPDTDFYIDYDTLTMMDTEMSEGVDDTKKKISKYEELALAANRAGDDEKCKLYQRKIQSLKQKMTQNVDEGIVGKVLGGAALIASLWGIGQNQAQQVYDNSPQLQTLIKYHQMATQQGDQAKIQELERRIENHKTRLSLGKGEVMGSDDKPIVPSFESSIMKGIQNEQNNDWGSMSKSEFKRREMEHELGDETKQDRQTWYIRINGKILKDKQKQPYTFNNKQAANKAALTMMSKPFNAGKKFTLTTSMMDAPDTGITEVVKSSFRQSVEDQANRYVEQIKSSNMPDWEKEYLILVNDPKGKVFRAAYHSFPKGQEARKIVADYISNKYSVSIDEIENLDMNELANHFTESKCPKCNGKLVAESELNEEGNKDACYHKVKSRYKVWPSAYASGALVKCRKVGASNWGDKKK